MAQWWRDSCRARVAFSRVPLVAEGERSHSVSWSHSGESSGEDKTGSHLDWIGTISIRVQVVTGSLRMHRHRSERRRVSVYCGTSRCWITDPHALQGARLAQVLAVGSREESFPFLSFHYFVLDASGNRGVYSVIRTRRIIYVAFVILYLLHSY